MMNEYKFATNLRAIREHSGLSQAATAKSVGISTNTYQRYEYGERDIPGDVLIKLANLFKTSSDYILKQTEEPSRVEYYVSSIPKSSHEFVDLPVMGEIAAGTPIEMTEIIDNHPCPKQIADKHPNSGWLRVEGDSYNRSIPNGCYALIDFDLKEPNEHSPFAVCVNGYSATIKRVKRLANGYELIPNSYDPTYLPMIYDYNKDDTEEITIIGQVVYAAFPFDWEF